MVSFEQFLELADIFAKHTGLTESTLSTRLFNDGKRLKMLREGNRERDVGIIKVENAVRHLWENWPRGAAWPRRIPQPVPQSEQAER